MVPRNELLKIRRHQMLCDDNLKDQDVEVPIMRLVNDFRRWLEFIHACRHMVSRM